MRFSFSLTYLLAAVALVLLPSMAPAQLASRPAEDWIKTLDAPSRVRQLKIQETVAKLGLKPGNIVADIGAGSGLFSVPLGQAVAPGGEVYAVDVEQGLLEHIARRAKEAHLENLQTVLGKFTDPNLPVTNVDLAFICDVLHHIEDRAGYLKNLARYLKPAGRIAIIDFYPQSGPHKNDPTLQVAKEQAAAWMAAIGFKPHQEFHLFADKWFVVYTR